MRFAAELLMLASLASAQIDWPRSHRTVAPSKDPENDFLGIVINKSPESFLVRTVDTRIVSFKVADSTLFFHGTKWASPSSLRRGAVVKVEAEGDRDGILTATDVVFQDVHPALRPRARASALLPAGVKDDPLIERAREASQSFIGTLLNFVCQQSTTRSYAGADKHWRTVDQVTAEVLYDHGHESYRDVKLNGKSTGRPIMDLPGSKSTGEFASTLRALFDAETGALFKFHGNAALTGFSTAVYDFAVSGDQSDWHIIAGSQMIMTSYTGKIWIDRASGHVVRIDMHAVDIPQTFPFQRVEAEVDYGPVVLPSGRYFLPERAENVSCNDPRSCSRNVIEFRNYHKYIGESSISFGEAAAADGEPK